MFQLNSYHANVQMKWLRENFVGGYVVRVAPAVMSLVLSFFGSIGLAVGVLANIAYLIRHLPVKAKKPLVFTARVKRMIVSFVVLSLICNVLCWFLRTNAMKYVNPTAVSIIMPFSSVLASIMSIILGYDVFSYELLIGGSIALFAVILSGFADIKYKK